MSSPDRLRPHPTDRFAPSTQFLDLPKAADELRAEPHEAVEGHRQIALYRHGPVTVVLFTFEEGGSLPEHNADGVVTIHVLEGRLAVEAAGRVHDAGPGGIVALDPGVLHSVRALEASEMLLTVHRLPA